MKRLIDRQLKNIEKAYESMSTGEMLKFSKSAVESLYQTLKELKEYKDLEITPDQVREINQLYWQGYRDWET